MWLFAGADSGPGFKEGYIRPASYYWFRAPLAEASTAGCSDCSDCCLTGSDRVHGCDACVKANSSEVLFVGLLVYG
jgi:hypothetical protein